MSKKKKLVRKKFRDAVFKRDGYVCRVCGIGVVGVDPSTYLDAHHITSREEMPGGGYVEENGISLCESCHRQAEHWLSEPNMHELTKIALAEYDPEELYKRIGSSHKDAYIASLVLLEWINDDEL